MIRFEKSPEPQGFDEKVRQKGRAWLESNPAPKRPKPFWTEVAAELRAAFRNLCAYSAIETFNGVVDHYRSCKNARLQAYEWSNYRYCLDQINKYKSTHDERILDPFEVQDEWFEVLIPSMQLVLTDRIPEDQRERAEFTLKQLRLRGGRDDEWIVQLRRSWYQRYLNKRVNLDGLSITAKGPRHEDQGPN